MNDLLALILTPLATEIREEIGQRFQQALEDNGELQALCEALQDAPDDFPPNWWLDSARSRFWLCLHLDWKASDEALWQMQAIARSLGLPTTFASILGKQPRVQPPDVLEEAAAWLRARGYELLGLDTGGDDYLAVPIRLDLLRLAFLAADRLSISTSLY